MTKAKIHSIETCGTVDGPGIRYVIFFQGCPLKCLYCHNPDTWDLGCKKAAEKTVAELLDDILKYKSFFKFSGGGVTASGGEPLMQKDFLAELFAECKKNNVSTALDTSGFTKIDDITKKLLNDTDIVMLDIKSGNKETFKKVAGVPIDTTIRFLEYLESIEKKIWIRFVLVPGHTDKEEELHELGALIKKYSCIERTDVLPFHQLGQMKWEALGKAYELKDVLPPTKAEVKKAISILREYVKEVY